MKYNLPGAEEAEAKAREAALKEKEESGPVLAENAGEELTVSEAEKE